MGGRNSKGTFNRQAEARQSQKKSYQKFRQSIGKLTKEVNKVKVENKEKLLELEIAVKSAANDLEIANTYTDPEFFNIFEDFLKKCEELDKIVKEKLEQNDKNLEESLQPIQRPNSPKNSEIIETQQESIDIVTNRPFEFENALFAEELHKPAVQEDKKKKKKSKTDDTNGDAKKDKKKKNKNKDTMEVNSVLSEDETTNQQEVEVAPSKNVKKGNSKKDKNKEDTLEVNFLLNAEENANPQVTDDLVTSKKDKKKDKKDKSKKNKNKDDPIEVNSSLNAEENTNPQVADDVVLSKKDKKNDKKDNPKKDKNKKNKNKEDSIEVNSLLNAEENVNPQVEDDSKKDKKNDKKNIKSNKEVDDNISSDTLDLDVPDKTNSLSKKRFWSFPMRLKRKTSTAVSLPETSDPVIIIQDPENEDRSLQNIEINQLETAIKNNNKKDKIKRQSKILSLFFDQQSEPPPTPASTPVPSPKLEPIVQQQDSLQQVHNIRMSIYTLEEMTKIYRLTKRGNYDYIYDNLCLCVNKLKDMETEPNVGMLTLGHEKKLAMKQVQECLDVLEGKIEVPERFDNRKSEHEDYRNSSGNPQVVISRKPSKKRDNCQKSVEFIEITNDDEVIDFSLQNNNELQANEEIAFDSNANNIATDMEKLKNISQDSSDEFSEDDDLKDILTSLQDSTEEISQEKTIAKKPLLISSF